MIVNEIAKLVNALQVPRELLLVAELSEALFVALRLVDVGDALRWCHFLSLRSRAPLHPCSEGLFRGVKPCTGPYARRRTSVKPNFRKLRRLDGCVSDFVAPEARKRRIRPRNHGRFASDREIRSSVPSVSGCPNDSRWVARAMNAWAVVRASPSAS